MNPEEISRALPALGLVGTMSLFLPSLDEAWRVDPDGPSLYRVKLRRGEVLYLAMSAGILTLASYSAGSTWPLFFGGAFAIAVVLTYEHALAHEPDDKR